MQTITAVIPIHNREDMLAEAIESVRSQSRPPDEIIDVDDGSTDGSAVTAASFEEVRLMQQEHRGVAAARNLGIRCAAGGLVAFLDSDDLWHRDKLLLQERFLEKNPGIPLCHTGELWIRKGRRVNPPARYEKRGGRVLTECLDVCFIAASTVMARTSLFDEIGLFDETFAACEDYDMWLRAACRHQVGYIEEALATRREGHAGQLSHTVPHLDSLRIKAIIKLLESGCVSGSEIESVLSALAVKTEIVVKGLGRKKRHAQARALRRQVARAFAGQGIDPSRFGLAEFP